MTINPWDPLTYSLFIWKCMCSFWEKAWPHQKGYWFRCDKTMQGICKRFPFIDFLNWLLTVCFKVLYNFIRCLYFPFRLLMGFYIEKLGQIGCLSCFPLCQYIYIYTCIYIYIYLPFFIFFIHIHLLHPSLHHNSHFLGC